MISGGETRERKPAARITTLPEANKVSTSTSTIRGQRSTPTVPLRVWTKIAAHATSHRAKLKMIAHVDFSPKSFSGSLQVPTNAT
jgi:hypothetical protein